MIYGSFPIEKNAKYSKKCSIIWISFHSPPLPSGFLVHSTQSHVILGILVQSCSNLYSPTYSGQTNWILEIPVDSSQFTWTPFWALAYDTALWLCVVTSIASLTPSHLVTHQWCITHKWHTCDNCQKRKFQPIWGQFISHISQSHITLSHITHHCHTCDNFQKRKSHII
jgi:hypothetical protein